MANAARLHPSPAVPASPATPAQGVVKRFAIPVNVRIHQGGEPVQPAGPATAPPITPAPAAVPVTLERRALATMLGVRLQEIETSLQVTRATPAVDLSTGQRAELERQQAAIKRALAMAEQGGRTTEAPVVVDATLRQLLGPMATVLTADEPGIDRLA